jgi:hypothetical protein
MLVCGVWGQQTFSAAAVQFPVELESWNGHPFFQPRGQPKGKQQRANTHKRPTHTKRHKFSREREKKMNEERVSAKHMPNAHTLFLAVG